VKTLFRIVMVLLLIAVPSLLSITASAQTEKFGIVKYTPPKGWDKTANENVIAFSKVNRETGKFFIITLYGATPGTGDPKSDFKREWNDLVVKPFAAEAEPKTETAEENGWTATAGGTAIDYQGGKAGALLTVITGGRTAVRILAVYNDESYLGPYAAFSSSIEMEKPVAATTAAAPIEAAATPMHAAALVREFETNEVRANQVWIGKRVRVYGTVNTIEIEKDDLIVLTFKSSISTYRNARCFFNKSQSARVATLSAHTEATVEGTVRGLGGGFDNSKAFLLLENCIVP
jgi:tRNA_anti-like